MHHFPFFIRATTCTRTYTIFLAPARQLFHLKFIKETVLVIFVEMRSNICATCCRKRNRLLVRIRKEATFSRFACPTIKLFRTIGQRKRHRRTAININCTRFICRRYFGIGTRAFSLVSVTVFDFYLNNHFRNIVRHSSKAISQSLLNRFKSCIQVMLTIRSQWSCMTVMLARNDNFAPAWRRSCRQTYACIDITDPHLIRRYILTFTTSCKQTHPRTRRIAIRNF